MRKLMGRRLTPLQVLFHLVLTIVAFFYMYPFLWMISGSLKTRQEFFSAGLNLLPKRLVWENYSQAWQDARFGTYFLNTVFVTVVATALTVLLTSMAGYALARSDFPGKRVIIAMILVTLFLPRGYTIIPIFDLVKKLGLLNTAWAIIVVNTATSMVFNTFLFLAYFTTLPKEVEETATIDGAGFPLIYARIALPLAKPMLGTVALLEFIDNWNSFFIPLVFTLGKPELRTISVGMYAFVGENAIDWTLMCAAATMSLLPTVMVFFLLQRLFVEGVAGAIKG